MAHLFIYWRDAESWLIMGFNSLRRAVENEECMGEKDRSASHLLTGTALFGLTPGPPPRRDHATISAKQLP